MTETPASETVAPAPRWLTPVAFLVPFALYLFTAARTIQGGDMGEFGLIGMVGGVAHPPGYPLYTLLARVFSLLPIDPPFFRISLTSVVCGAATVAVLQRIAWRLTGSVVASLSTALVFAVSSIQWRLAGVPEVFSLHGLCVALAMLFALRLVDAPTERLTRAAIAFGLVLGLSSSNHHTTVLLAPLLFTAIFAVWRRTDAATGLKTAGLIFATGILSLAPYLLLLVWGAQDRAQVWAWGDTGTLKGLIPHVLRAEYGTFSLAAKRAATATLRIHYVLTSLRQFPVQYAYVLFLAGVAGIAVGWRRHRTFAIGLLGSLLTSAVIFPSLMNLPRTEVNAEVTERFFLMPMVLFAPMVAWGLHALTTRLQAVPLTALIALGLALNAVHSFPLVNWRRDTIVERYLVASVSSLPQNAVLLGRNDTTLPGMAWLARVMKIRPDIRYIDVNILGLRWYYDRVKAVVPDFPLDYVHARHDVTTIAKAAAAVGPTYLVPWVVDNVKQEIEVRPNGLLYRVAAPGEPPVPVEAFQAMMDRDMALLGDATGLPVDAWNGKVHQAIAYSIADLMDAHKAAGHDEKAAELLDLAGRIIPPDSPDDIDVPSAGGEFAETGE